MAMTRARQAWCSQSDRGTTRTRKETSASRMIVSTRQHLQMSGANLPKLRIEVAKREHGHLPKFSDCCSVQPTKVVDYTTAKAFMQAITSPECFRSELPQLWIEVSETRTVALAQVQQPTANAFIKAKNKHQSDSQDEDIYPQWSPSEIEKYHPQKEDIDYWEVNLKPN